MPYRVLVDDNFHYMDESEQQALILFTGNLIKE
jgi:hypothetical protein